MRSMICFQSSSQRSFLSMMILMWILALGFMSGCGGDDEETGNTSSGSEQDSSGVAETSGGGGTEDESTQEPQDTTDAITQDSTAVPTVDDSTAEETEASSGGGLNCDLDAGDNIAARDVPDNTARGSFYAFNDSDTAGACHLVIKYRGETVEFNDESICLAAGSDTSLGSFPAFEFYTGDLNAEQSGDYIGGVVIKETTTDSFIDYDNPTSTPLGLGGDIGLAFWFKNGSDDNVVTSIGGKLTYSCVQDGADNLQKGTFDLVFPSKDLQPIDPNSVSNNGLKGNMEAVLSDITSEVEEFLNFGNGNAYAKFDGADLDMNYNESTCAGSGTGCAVGVAINLPDDGIIQFILGDLSDDTAPIIIGVVLRARVRTGGSASLDGASALIFGWETVEDLFNDEPEAFQSSSGSITFVEGGKNSGERFIINIDATIAAP